MTDFSIDVDAKAVIAKYGEAAMKKATEQALADTMQYTADLVKEKITSGGHVETGFLRASVTFKRSSNEQGEVFAKHGSGVYYVKFVEHGTGIYGPTKQPIKPKSAKRLAWHPRSETGKPLSSKGKIVRRTVKGQKPVKMFHRTFTEDKAKIEDRFNKKFHSALSHSQ